MKPDTYVGLDRDLEEGNGVTTIAKIVLDARLFGLIGESETCAGWPGGKIQELYDRVNVAWDRYGHLPSRLPEELRSKHTALYEPAIEKARRHGWDPEKDLAGEER